MLNTHSTMGLKQKLLKKALELKLKKATDGTKKQIQKLYQKVDELISNEKENGNI